jgi:hypothetical protein
LISSPSTTPWRRLLAWMGLAIVLVIWLFALAVPAWKIAESAGEIAQGRASLGWQTAPGRITYAQLRDRSVKGRTYVPIIGYRYQASGRTWTSYRIEATSGYNPVQARKIMERFPLGAGVTVYHDGQGKSVLIPGVRANSWFGLGLWLLWFWGVVAVTWYELARHRKKRRQQSASA